MEIKAGQIYRHFKGAVYEIITVAWHTESGEPLVVYGDSDDRMWARPLSNFTSLVDRAKYPDAGQTYRFEQISSGGEDS